MRDRSFGAGHVVAFDHAGTVRGSPLVVALDLRAASLQDVARAVGDHQGSGVGCAMIVDSEIVSGEWPLVGTRLVREDTSALLRREAGTTSSGGLFAWFLDAYFGIAPWDALFDPRHFELMLLPGVPPPVSRRYVRDLVERRMIEMHGRHPSPIVTGPGLLDVHIAYPGDGLPRLIDLPKSRQLAERMRRDVPGAATVVTGGGRGFLDVFANTSDAASGVRAAETAARDLGIHRETMVEAFPAVSLEGLTFT
jgi:hypothetical protein